MTNNWKVNMLLGIFVALLIGMNLLGVKVVEIFGIAVSVGIFMAPITFLITDIIEEVYGKKVVGNFLATGLTSLIIVFVYTAIFVVLEPAGRYDYNEEYRIIFGSSLRIMAASFVAFSLAQLNDMFVFEFLKNKTEGRSLWLRNNISTMLSQAIDTFVFMFIAFWQITPKFDLAFIISLAIPYYLFKIAFAALDTPLVYLGVWWLREENTTTIHEE
ncbi:MAG: hypothetical protein B6242_01025 [Anaerolineaceae bacterium 4572_78]|nr:MAG: hypothetical protein B6242_01025 [Anaerolineaceae bacterium 4572_78]